MENNLINLGFIKIFNFISIKILMKCFKFNRNIGLVCLFFMFCISNSIIIDNNNILKGSNNIITKPNLKNYNSDFTNLIKINQLKKIQKIAHDELKILKSKKDRIEKSMKRLSLSLINRKSNNGNDDVYLSLKNNDYSNNNINNNFLNNNISILISFSALFFGFIFAIVFLAMAYLVSEGITLKLDQTINQLSTSLLDFL